MSNPGLRLDEGLTTFSKLVVGYSGGLDSTVLLHLLASQADSATRLLAVHVNHGISPNAMNWQQHCQCVCDQLGIPLVVESVEFDPSKNIEAHARAARYQALAGHLAPEAALVLAHHQDDQAETLLMNLFRGAGISGLAAMQAVSHFQNYPLYRPLLDYSRAQLEDYAKTHALIWIEDESNTDLHYTRNFVRQSLMPTLRQRWPAVTATLARAASHCHQAEENLEALAKLDADADLSQRRLNWTRCINLPKARRANVMQQWFRQQRLRMPTALTFDRLIEELFSARPDSQPQIVWDGWQIRRYQDYFYLLEAEQVQSPACIDWDQFPAPLQFGGRRVQVAAGAELLQGQRVSVRRRQGGERILCQGQHKSLKKLLQAASIPPWERDQLPLIYENEVLILVPGLVQADGYAGLNIQVD